MVTLIRKIFLLDILKGLYTTLKHLPREPITLQYPRKRWTPAPGYRGVVGLIHDEQGNELCNACGLCAKSCPVEAITVEAEGKGKERRAVRYEVDLTRCMFCNMCVEACPQRCLVMTPDYELAACAREELQAGKDFLYGPRQLRLYYK